MTKKWGGKQVEMLNILAEGDAKASVIRKQTRVSYDKQVEEAQAGTIAIRDKYWEVLTPSRETLQEGMLTITDKGLALHFLNRLNVTERDLLVRLTKMQEVERKNLFDWVCAVSGKGPEDEALDMLFKFGLLDHTDMMMVVLSDIGCRVIRGLKQLNPHFETERNHVG